MIPQTLSKGEILKGTTCQGAQNVSGDNLNSFGSVFSKFQIYT
jgi:hypothetical protein